MKYFLIIFSLLFLNACNPLDSQNEGKSTIESGYNPFLKFPGFFSFISSTSSSQEITFTWNQSEGSEYYEVKYGTSSGNYNIVSMCKKSPCRITGLIDGTTYYVMVYAINPKGSRAISSEISIQPPGTGYQNFAIDIPFSAGTESSYLFSNLNSVELSGGYVRLIASLPTDSEETETADATISSGTKNGVAYDLLSDNQSLGLKIGNDGACNGADTNCLEFDPLWTPRFSSLVGYWKLNGSVGVIPNNTPLQAKVGPAGLIKNTSNTGTAYVAGKLKQGIDLDGIDSYIDFGGNVASLNLGRNDQTVAFWTKFSNPINYFVSKSSYRANNARWFILSGNPGCGPSSGTIGIYMFVQGEGPNYCSPVATGFNDNKWHHVVGVWKRSEKMYLYVDGILRANLDISSIRNLDLTNTDPFYIGQHGNSGGTGPHPASFGSGTIDEVAIWHTALTKEEVELIYSRQAVKYAGSFTSRVINGFNSTSNWQHLAWKTTLPFLKGLPDAGCSPGPTCVHTNSEVSTPEIGYPSLVGSTGSIGDDNLMSNIVGLWHFDEATGSTTIADKSGKNNTGTVSGATLGSPGKIGTAAYFNGTTNITAAATNIPQGASPRTVAMWIKQQSAGNTSFFSYGDNSTGSLWEMMVYNSSLMLHAHGGVFDTIAVSAPVTLNQWNHVAISYTGSSVRIYVNGVYKGAVSLNLNTKNTFFNIGGPGYFDRWNGLVDELAIWSRVLDNSEIKQLYQRGASRVLYQARTCAETTCACQTIALGGSASDCDGDGIINSLDKDDVNFAIWKGPSGNDKTYFSELNNSSVPQSGNGNIKKTLPNLDLSIFTSPISNNKYFQYRIFLESDDDDVDTLGPEVISTNSGPVRYDNSNPFVTSLGSIGSPYELLDAYGFFETLGTEGCIGAKYSISGNGIDFFYYNGSFWEISDGSYAESSSALDVKNNFSTLVSLMGIGTIQVKTFLHSDGMTACEVDKIHISGKKFY